MPLPKNMGKEVLLQKCVASDKVKAYWETVKGPKGSAHGMTNTNWLLWHPTRHVNLFLHALLYNRPYWPIKFFLVKSWRTLVSWNLFLNLKTNLIATWGWVKRIDDPAEGWHYHFNFIALYQQQPIGSTYQFTFFNSNT